MGESIQNTPDGDISIYLPLDGSLEKKKKKKKKKQKGPFARSVFNENRALLLLNLSLSLVRFDRKSAAVAF